MTAEQGEPEPIPTNAISPTGGVVLCPACRIYRPADQLAPDPERDDDVNVCAECRGVPADPHAVRQETDRAAQAALEEDPSDGPTRANKRRRGSGAK